MKENSRERRINDLHRIEALLSAGLRLQDALEHLHDSGVDGRWANMTVPKSIDEVAENAKTQPDDAVLLVGMWLNRRYGMPLIRVIQTARSEIEWRNQQSEKARTATAQTKATLWLIMMLPPLILIGAESIGLAPLRTMIVFPFSLFVAVAGIVAIWASVRWMRKLVTRATRLVHDPGVADILVAETLIGGTSYSAAEQAVRECFVKLGWDTTAQPLFDAFAESKKAGVPLVGLLRARALLARQERDQKQAQQLALLPVKILSPLGLCALPGFLMLTVFPIATGLLFSTTGGMP